MEEYLKIPVILLYKRNRVASMSFQPQNFSKMPPSLSHFDTCLDSEQPHHLRSVVPDWSDFDTNWLCIGDLFRHFSAAKSSNFSPVFENIRAFHQTSSPLRTLYTHWRANFGNWSHWWPSGRSTHLLRDDFAVISRGRSLLAVTMPKSYRDLKFWRG